jgi:NADH pyrophosphatase NudC (nudix superfamily)
MCLIMFVVNVEGAIYRDGKWLIIQRGFKEAHAAGALSLVGGKVENEGNQSDILERTLQREIFEEVGIEVSNSMHYVHSTSFVASDGEPVINVVFLCSYLAGEACRKSPDEVEDVLWLTTDEILEHPKAPAWTKDSIRRASEVLHRIQAMA